MATLQELQSNYKNLQAQATTILTNLQKATGAAKDAQVKMYAELQAKAYKARDEYRAAVKDPSLLSTSNNVPSMLGSNDEQYVAPTGIGTSAPSETVSPDNPLNSLIAPTQPSLETISPTANTSIGQGIDVTKAGTAAGTAKIEVKGGGVGGTNTVSSTTIVPNPSAAGTGGTNGSNLGSQPATNQLPGTQVQDTKVPNINDPNVQSNAATDAVKKNRRGRQSTIGFNSSGSELSTSVVRLLG